MVEGVPQIYWPRNGNTWKCVMGLAQMLKSASGLKSTKKWYDGVRNSP